MAKVVCVGGACVDRKYQVLSVAQTGTSNPARARRSFGGVARNVAENLARLGAQTALVSVVGNDENGVALLEHAARAGIDTRLVIRDSNHVTPEYGAIVAPDGNLIIGVADMSATDAIRINDLERHWETIACADWLFVDCNLPGEVLAWCIVQARGSSVKLAVDAVSEPKVCRLPDDLTGVDLLVLNEKEAAVYLYEDLETFRARAPLDRVRALRGRGAGAVILTRGSDGLIAGGERSAELPALSAECLDVTGAGDALIAATIYRLAQGDDLLDAARIGSLCAGLTVESPASVRPDLSQRLLRNQHHRLDACAAS
ncbi:MAG TPA: carbohydrate kinase family protein [Candidatus Baltobacteraceae bacterium]|nr:carbohydrate kinase family protein [Candidatus Baltobacteraceae bacterium]